MLSTILLLKECKESKEINITKIDNNSINRMKFKESKKESIKVHIKGYDMYQSRYMIPFDEKNKNRLELYNKYNFKEITTEFSFSNLNKDTLYTFPLTDKTNYEVFGKKYMNSKNGHIDDIIDVYLKIYTDEKLGSAAIIDSIR